MQARLLHRQLLRHLHRTGLVHDRPVGEAAAAENGREQRAVGRTVQPPPRAEVVRAAARIAAQARGTRIAAGRAPRDHDAVAGRERGHALADLLDDAGALVAEQDRERQSPAARLDDVQVAVADPAGLDAHLHLARPGRIERDLLDGGPRLRVRVDDAATAHACNLLRCTSTRRSARSDSSHRSGGCAGSSGRESPARAGTTECSRRRRSSSGSTSPARAGRSICRSSSRARTSSAAHGSGSSRSRTADAELRRAGAAARRPARGARRRRGERRQPAPDRPPVPPSDRRGRLADRVRRRT